MTDKGIDQQIYCRNRELVLKIFDEHRWGDGDREHLASLISEVKSFVSMISSGELYDEYPQAKGKPVIVEIKSKYPLNEEAKNVFELLKKSFVVSYRFT